MMDDLSALVMLAYPTLFTKHLASEFVRDYIANVSHITLSAALSHYIQQHHIDQVPLAALQSEPSNAVQALRNKVLNNDANNECTKSALKVWVQRSTVQKSVDGQPLTVPVYRWSTMEPVQAAEPAVNKVKREAPIPVRPAPTISSSGRKLKKPKLLIHDQSVAVVKREQSSKRHDTVPNKKRKLAHSQTSNVSKPVNKAVPVSASVSVNAAPTSSAVTRLRSLPPVTRPWSNDEKVTLYQLIDKRHTYRHVAHLVQRSVEDVERTYMQLCGEPYADEHGYRLFVVGAVLEERYNKAKHRQEYLVHWTGYEAARDSVSVHLQAVATARTASDMPSF